MKTRQAKTPEATAQMYVRLPLALRDAIADFAKNEGRSVNSLIVELLQEKVDSLSAVSSMAERDPLTAAWYAAESAELFSRSIRGAILRCRVMEEDPGDLDIPGFLMESAAPAAVQESAPALGDPISQLTPLQRELLEEFSRTPPEMLEAMRTLMKR